jgi:thioredoxin-like negative regulator of GroEL
MSLRSSFFRTKLEANPGNDLFRFSLSQALFEEENLAECMEGLQSCLERRPDWMIAALLLGKAKIKAGNLEEARRILEATIKMAQDQDHEGPEEEARTLLAECRAGR